jgi:hypothetical protein
MAGNQMLQRSIALPSLFLALLVAPAMPQTPTDRPRIEAHGRVLDPTLTPIAGARITVLPGGSSALSDPNGEFAVSLGGGSYILKVAADGFQELSQTVDVPRTGLAPREFILHVAGKHETVTVTEQAGYRVASIRSGTKTPTPLRDVPQSVTVVTRELMADQMMMSIGDVVRYVPGITATQGENNRDQVVIRGNSSSADFFLDGTRDDVQYYRDL